MSDQEFWRSRAHYIKADSFEELCQKLNDFAKDKWVIAWQIYTDAAFKNLHAVVTYKWKE